MGRVLVVYGTRTGCTREIAERLGARLGAGGARVDVAAADGAALSADHGAVVVGSGVRVGKWHGAVRDWVGDHAAELKARPVAFYTVGLRVTEPGRTEEVRAYTDPLRRETGVEPLDLGLFAGWNLPERFSYFERLALKALKTPVGDFRDWGAIEAWAARVWPRLGRS